MLSKAVWAAAAVLMMEFPLAAAQAQVPPLYDINNYCRNSIGFVMGYDRWYSQNVTHCIELERFSYTVLKDQWPMLNAEGRQYCLDFTKMGGRGSSYQILLACASDKFSGKL